MLFKEINFQEIDIKQKLTLQQNTHVSTWEHYLNCYSSSIQHIFEIDLLNKYIFNSKARGILFLLRHTFELTIKKNLHLLDIRISNTHDYTLLLESLQSRLLAPIEFRNAIDIINKDSTGECFRYFSDKNNVPFFTMSDTIELTDLIVAYKSINLGSFQFEPLFPDAEYEKRTIKWNLTLSLGEARGLGHVKTQFDQTIEFFLERILTGEIDINQVYLPLLALIRNALEIGFKYNIQLAKEMFTSESNLNIEDVHSLTKLHSIFGDSTGYLSRVDFAGLREDIRKEYYKHLKEFKFLYTNINMLDKNSYFFRFPFDPNGNRYSLQLKRDSVYNILKSYYATNSFFTFINAVLHEEGLK